MKLTKTEFSRLEPPNRLKRITAENQQNIIVELTPRKKSIYLKYISPTTLKQRQILLASYTYGEEITADHIKNALTLADNYRGDIAARLDPLDEKARIRAEERSKRDDKKNQVLLKDAWRAYTRHRDFIKLSVNTQNQYYSTYNAHIKAELGDRDVRTISIVEINAYIEHKQDAAHNRVLVILKNIQRPLIKKGILATPFTYGIEPRATRSRHDRIEPELLGEYIRYLERDKKPTKQASYMQLLTGCRITEVLKMKWEHVDLDNRTIAIPPENIKTQHAWKFEDRPHIIPLFAKQLEILLWCKQFGDTGYIFKKHRRQSIPYARDTIGIAMEEGGLGTRRTHIIRHTCASLLSEHLDIDDRDIDLLLNHSISGTKKKYVHSQFLDKKIKFYTIWHKYLEELRCQTMTSMSTG